MNKRLELVQQFADEQARLGSRSHIKGGCDLQDLMSSAMEDPRFIALGLHRGDKGMVAFEDSHGDAALCRFMGLATKSNSPGTPTSGSIGILHGKGGILEIQKTIQRLIKQENRTLSTRYP